MQEIQQLRRQIDKIDTEIADLLRKRLALIKEIKEQKAKKNTQVKDSNREQEILEKLETDFEKAIFRKILSESRKEQRAPLT